MALLKPPPERSDLDKGALEGEGRERYLNSLGKSSLKARNSLYSPTLPPTTTKERRLNRLQGTDKRKITSKDIMNSLSEAKESHMMQPSRDLPLETQTSGQSSSGQSTSATRPILESEPARNDPWSVPQTVDTHQTERIDSSDNRHQSDEEEQQSDEFFVDVQLKRSGCGFMSCLMSCTACLRRRQSSTGRWRLRGFSDGGSSLTAEEERAYLMQCDQLGLASWGKDEDDDIWSTD